MKKDLHGKVVLITGSSTGIGKCLAIHLGKSGAKVVLNARNKERLLQTLQELQSMSIDCIALNYDISDYHQCEEIVEQTLKHYGQLDILVQNAGISMRGPVSRLNPRVVDMIFHTNLLAPYYLSSIALPELQKTEGSMVFISSLAGLRGLPFLSAYSSAKMGLTGLVEALQLEHLSDKVNIGIVYVGITKNDVGKTTIGHQGEAIPLDERKGVFTKSIDEVAISIKNHILKRKRKTVIGVSGKVYYFITRYTPWLVKISLKAGLSKMKGYYR